MLHPVTLLLIFNTMLDDAREQVDVVDEAAFEEALEARAVRSEALGTDRHFRRYWWLPGACLLLEHLVSRPWRLVLLVSWYLQLSLSAWHTGRPACSRC